MTVTEFALIELRCDYKDLDFLETLMQCQEVQDEWVFSNNPCEVEHEANVSSMYIDKSHKPPTLLITAPWDSPDAHGQWIQSTDNQTVFGKLSKFIRPGCHSTTLVHLESAGKQQQLSEDFLSQESFNVSVLEVEPCEKDTLQKAYQKLEDRMLEFGPKQRIWAGWKIERPDAAEGLVVFWSKKKVPEAQIDELTSFCSKSARRNFEHVV